MNRDYTLLCPFGGLGAGALGFQLAERRLFETSAHFRLLGGIDIDAAACADFEYLTGVPELCADVGDLTVSDVRARFGEHAPDVVFLSPPCKGASGLLSEKQARKAKYRKLNALALAWIRLMLETWSGAPPRLVLFENVPRIVSRARRVLGAVRAHLRRAGYVLHEGFHDCGEIGGLAQHRRRYLLVARHQRSVPTLLYQPTPKRVRACGEVLGPLPMPNDPAGGPLHKLPAIGWLNWVRLALIPAGGDWRDLPGVLEDGEERCAKFKRHAVEPWTAPTGTVGGSGSNGVANVADPRSVEWFGGVLGVAPWASPAATVTGAASPSRGEFSVADPRVRCEPRAGAYGVQAWGEPAATVTGCARVDNSPAAVADPRVRLRAQDGAGVHHNKYSMADWSKPARTVIGATRPGSGAQSVADPRVREWFGNVLRVIAWGEPSGTVTSGNGPTNGGGAVADPLVKTAYPHGYGVIPWDRPSFTIAAGTMPGQGAYSVQDPRVARASLVGVIPLDHARATVTGETPAPFAIVDPSSDGPPVMVVRDVTRAPPAAPVILAADGTWHRPLTTLELAVLQGLPAVHRGKPLALAGTSNSAHRERIGNAVPVQASQAIAEQMLLTLLSADLGAFALSSGGAVWVSPDREAIQ